MKITEINDEEVVFDNGNRITYHHCPDCCEVNYADFSYLEDETGIFETEFPEDILIEPVDGAGFRFGTLCRNFFVPCYSEQNGYYSTDIYICYSDKDGHIISDFNLDCEECLR